MEPSDLPSPHAVSSEALLAAQRVDAQHGLTGAAAAARLQQFGPNALPETQRKPMWRVFLAQFQSPLIYLLLVAAVLAFALGKREDAAVILIVVLINSIIGAFQEGRAERSMESLRKLSALKVHVRRDERDQEIAACELVPGDVLLLAAGDAVGADARLVETAALECAEAALTGEARRDCPPACRGRNARLHERHLLGQDGPLTKNEMTVTTLWLTVLAVCQWFNVLNCESATRSALRLGIFKKQLAARRPRPRQRPALRRRLHRADEPALPYRAHPARRLFPHRRPRQRGAVGGGNPQVLCPPPLRIREGASRMNVAVFSSKAYDREF